MKITRQQIIDHFRSLESSGMLWEFYPHFDWKMLSDGNGTPEHVGGHYATCVYALRAIVRHEKAQDEPHHTTIDLADGALCTTE